MKGAWRIATIAGIPVEIHWTFALLGVYVFYLGQTYGLDWSTMGWIALLILSLFACVILHEFGHALTARRYGVHTRDIILSPIGGVARLERLPEKPIQEFYIALAGPIVNIMIVLVLLPYFFIYSLQDFKTHLDVGNFSDPVQVIPFLILGNITLAGFNLLPAFPMDGGRILRALLAIRWGRLKATRIAAYLGNFAGIMMVAYGVYAGHLTSIFIGIFVFMLAMQEYRMVRMESLLKGTPISEILRTQFTLLPADVPMSQALEIFQHGLEKSFLVTDDTREVAGVLHEAFLVEARKTNDIEAPILEYTSQRFEKVQPDTSLFEIFQKMQHKGYSILPVYDETDVLLGVVDISMLNNFLRFQRKTR